MRFAFFLVAAAILAGCGDKSSVQDDLTSIDLTLPGGQVVKAEPMIDPKDMLRGMQFRASLKSDHGMLYFHQQPGQYVYWMLQTIIPLDMIWLDSSHEIVEIVPNAPPCRTTASQCAWYGGHQTAKYILQLGGGMARKYNLQLGQRIQF